MARTMRMNLENQISFDDIIFLTESEAPPTAKPAKRTKAAKQKKKRPEQSLTGDTGLPQEELLSANASDINLTGLDAYIHSIANIPILTDEEESKINITLLSSSNQDEIKRAKTRLIEGNLRKIISVAAGFNKKLQMPILDLIQEGNLGLMRAAEKYDPTKNVKFFTYAMHWVRRAMLRAADDQARTIRIPSNALSEVRRIQYVKQKIFGERFGQVGENELNELAAQELGTTADKVVELEKAMASPISLQTTPSEEDDAPLESIVTDENALSVEDTVVEHMISERIEQMLEKLDEREKYIIVERYGLRDNGAKRLLEDIGHDLGLTRERVRQLEAQAIIKMRKSTAAAELKDLIPGA